MDSHNRCAQFRNRFKLFHGSPWNFQIESRQAVTRSGSFQSLYRNIVARELATARGRSLAALCGHLACRFLDFLSLCPTSIRLLVSVTWRRPICLHEINWKVRSLDLSSSSSPGQFFASLYFTLFYPSISPSIRLWSIDLLVVLFQSYDPK